MDALSKTIDGYVDKAKAAMEGKIDFEGQRKADFLNHCIFSIATIVAFVVGYAMQSMVVTFGIYGAGFVIALIAIVPPWPTFNQHPIDWLPSLKKEGKIKIAK